MHSLGMLSVYILQGVKRTNSPLILNSSISHINTLVHHH